MNDQENNLLILRNLQASQGHCTLNNLSATEKVISKTLEQLRISKLRVSKI